MYAIPADITACHISTGNLKSILNIPPSNTGEDFIKSIKSDTGTLYRNGTKSHPDLPRKITARNQDKGW
jgi:hypothetical protein